MQVGCECDLGNNNIIFHRNKFSVRIGVEWSGDYPVAEGRLKPISDTAAVK